MTAANQVNEHFLTLYSGNLCYLINSVLNCKQFTLPLNADMGGSSDSISDFPKDVIGSIEMIDTDDGFPYFFAKKVMARIMKSSPLIGSDSCNRSPKGLLGNPAEDRVETPNDTPTSTPTTGTP